MMLEQFFTELGFSSTEARVWLSLADTGKSTAQLLAKRVDIPRTTAYSALESLQKKGLVSVEQKRGGTFFSANKPESLLRLIEREKENLGKKESAAAALVELVRPYFKSKLFSVPTLQFFDGKAGVENMLYDSLERWVEAMAGVDKTWWGFQDHTFVQHYRKWLEHYWRMKTPDEQVHLLSNQAEVENELRGKVPGRDIRPIPAQFEVTSTIWVMGSYIAVIVTRQEPHYAYQIHDPVLSSNLRSLFQFLWTLA